MGCCGCTLQTSAIVAAVFGILESLAGLIGGSVAISNLSYASYIYRYYFDVVRNVMISATVFNVLWLVATVVLIIGIAIKNAAMHRVWVGVTSVIMVVDLAHTIALVVAIVNVGGLFTSSYQYISTSGGYTNYTSYYNDSGDIFISLLLMTAVTRGSVWLWIINICLTIYTAHRANEIEIERGPVPFQQATTVIIYPNQPMAPYPPHGQFSGPPAGMPPTYEHQQPQYGQPQGQYGQPQTNPYSSDPGLSSKY